eukprot:464464-Amphidinium_carterae.1
MAVPRRYLVLWIRWHEHQQKDAICVEIAKEPPVVRRVENWHVANTSGSRLINRNRRLFLCVGHALSWMRLVATQDYRPCH